MCILNILKNKKEQKVNPSTNDNTSITKVVFFDELSATDYIDISDGGKTNYSSEEVKKRMTKLTGNASLNLFAKLSWIPVFGGEGDVGAKADISKLGQNLITKTLSNTVLTDYLQKVQDDPRIVKFLGYKLSVHPNSLAYYKMYTPYMIIVKKEDIPIDVSMLDEALERAKGYYELIAINYDSECVLRFNIKAFRNNYGLSDLLKMDLVFHAVHVGATEKRLLELELELPSDIGKSISARELLDGNADDPQNALKVYDVIFAGIQHV